MGEPTKNTNPWEPSPQLGTEWSVNPWDILSTPLEIGTRVWNNFKASFQNQAELTFIKDASDNWGVNAQRWRLSLTKDYLPYVKVYGFIFLAAQKRNIRPEFLHAVIFGEGLNRFIDSRVGLEQSPNIDAGINGYNYLGLDQIGSRLQMLVDGNYLEKKYLDKYWVPEHMNNLKNELNTNTSSGIIVGFEAAAEMVAAELQQRGDYMKEVAERNGVIVETETEREFLMYGKYVSSHYAEDQLTSTEALKKNCSKWDKTTDGEWPGDSDFKKPNFYRYKSLIRIATAEWYANALIYRR